MRHVFDRGYGTGPWLSRLSHFRVRFVLRWKKGNKLLDEAGCERTAWEIAFSYVSRWQIEEQFRFQKTALLMASLRLRDWEPRRKLLLLVTLAYGFGLRLSPLGAGSLLRAGSLALAGSLGATRRLAAVERQTSSLSAPLAAQSARGSPILPPARARAGGLIVPSPTSPGRLVQYAGA